VGFFRRTNTASGSSSEADIDARAAHGLDAGFIDGILDKTHFPVTEYNRAAVRAMMHVMLRTKACQYITYDKPQDVADVFVESHALRGRETSLADLQRLVDDVILLQPACAPYMQDEPEVAESILLEIAASGGGMFERGPSQPLLVYGET
jgi:hypothetical protein